MKSENCSEPVCRLVRLLRKDGEWRWIESFGQPRFSDTGEILGMAGSSFDLTERKQAEIGLQLSEEKFATAFSQNATALALTDLETGKYLDVNETWLDMFGYTKEEVVGRTALDLKIGETPDDRICVMDELRAGSSFRNIEVMPLRRSGERFVVLSSADIITLAGKKAVLSSTLDVTDRKRAEEALLHAKEELELRVQERTKELALRANQLRALAGELTISEQRERKRLSALLHDHLQQLLVGAKFRLTVLGNKADDDATKQGAKEVENLIDESIKSSRSLTAELSPPILHDAGLNGGLEWLGRRMADTHGLFVDLRTEQIGSLPEDLTILLFEAVRELLFNTAKHANTPSASVIVRRIENFLELTISDQGVGFDPHNLPPAGESGRGFGLFSIGERVGLFGGRLEMKSAPGQGSQFVITVPITSAKLKSTVIAELPKEVVRKLIPTQAPGKKIRILLADDHSVVRQGIANLLKDEPDFEVVGEAANGRDAVNLTTKWLPDVVLMDMSMPILNGIEATRAIHKDHPEIRVIGLSMFEEADKAQEMRDAGAVNYLTKSGPAEELIDAIRKAVGRPQKELSQKPGSE